MAPDVLDAKDEQLHFVTQLEKESTTHCYDPKRSTFFFFAKTNIANT